MAGMIISAFKKYPKEAAAVGRLLLAYGELEIDLAICLSEVLGLDTALRVIFRVRGERQRIEVADALMRHEYAKAANSHDAYGEAIGCMHYCRKIRNQYAHSQWEADQAKGLMLSNLDTWSQDGGVGAIERVSISRALLDEQETFFSYTQACLKYAHWEYLRAGATIPNPRHPRPPKVHRPPLYNP